MIVGGHEHDKILPVVSTRGPHALLPAHPPLEYVEPRRQLATLIGSNYIRHVLSTTDDEITVYDALTYAGNLVSIRGERRLPWLMVATVPLSACIRFLIVRLR